VLILAVDTATPSAGVALIQNEQVINESLINFRKTHSETLMPTIDRLLKECSVAVQDLDALAVSSGPGSFTGLRIGMAAIKGISLAAAKPIVAVSTLDTLAANIAGSDALICPLLDARKNEVYCGFYVSNGLYPMEIKEPAACSPEEFMAAACNIADTREINKIILLGDGYYRYQHYFDTQLNDRLIRIPGHLMLPRAAAVGILAAKKAQLGDYVNIYQIRPIYIRLSEAEYRLGKGAV
jgi:tRNA threonylcarbamoyladenosine biosynthesis protein TsaB